ncbi:MAG: hypothetical protein DDT19_02740 [Syntrophomonadaceae bacterium]|nr:hypothetical protein [Bacillota bacterium]
MAWEEVTTSAVDIKKHKGKIYQGFYTGKREIETKIGKQIIYSFEDEEGIFSIYGFTNLNRAMENVKQGLEVRITYLGTEKVQTKFGLKDVHQVRVEINKDSDPHSETGEPF